MPADTNGAPAQSVSVAQAMADALSAQEELAPVAAEADAPAETAERTTETAAETSAETQPKRYKVIEDGQELEVDEPELLRGYSGTRKFTQRMQQLADREKAIDAAEAQARETRAKYADLLGQAEVAVHTLTQEPDWNSLRASLSPKDYATARDTWDLQTKRLQAIRAERERVSQEQANDLARTVERFKRDEQDRLLNAVPEWREPTKAQTERQQLLDYAKARGFGEDDLKNVHDHRLWLVLRDAARWHHANATPPKAPAKPALRTASPGSPQPKPKTAAAEEAMAKLRKTGRQSDAASALLAAMGDRL